MTQEEPEISLEAYATVTAGLSAGLDRRGALAAAGVEPPAWDRSVEAWHARIDESAATDLELLVAFDAALLTARRRFEPTVEPITADVKAWAQFRRHFLTSVDPPAFLAQRGLSLGAYARLEGDWANRALSDEALAAKLDEHMRAPLEPCPEIVLTPSPLLVGARVAPPPPRSVEAPVPLAPRAALNPGASGAPVQRPSFMAAQAAEPPPLSPLLPAPTSPPLPAAPPPPAAQPSLDQTGFAHPSMLNVPLPFAPKGPSPAAGFAAPAGSRPRVSPPPKPAGPPLAAPMGPGGDALSGTVFGAQAPAGLALPFAPGGAPPAPPPPRPPPPPRAAAPAPAKRDPLMETRVGSISSEALPFLAAKLPAQAPAEAWPAAHSAPPPARPGLTLEYYAAMCVELSTDPGRAAQIYARYGIAGAAAWQVAHADWQSRLRADPALTARWQGLLAHYRAYYEKR